MSSPKNKQDREVHPDEIDPGATDNSRPYYATADQCYHGQTDWNSLTPHTGSNLITNALLNQSAFSDSDNIRCNPQQSNFVGNSDLLSPWYHNNLVANSINNNIALPSTTRQSITDNSEFGGVNTSASSNTFSSIPSAFSQPIGQSPSVPTPTRIPYPPPQAEIRKPNQKSSTIYYTTVDRDPLAPNLQAPGLSCTDPACQCDKTVWPTSGVLQIRPCAVVCEVCGMYRSDYTTSTGNLRSHVRDHHLLSSTNKGKHGQSIPARLYKSVTKA